MSVQGPCEVDSSELPQWSVVKGLASVTASWLSSGGRGISHFKGPSPPGVKEISHDDPVVEKTH